MSRTALVIGGTGPSGPDIVRTLLDRDYRVSVLHRGVHEPDDEVLRQVEHVHVDPHFAGSLADGLGTRTFDVVIATYGRMRLNVEACRGRCERFVGIGGNPVHAGHLDRRGSTPTGMRILADEQSPRTEATKSDRDRFALRVREAEECVFTAANDGAFTASYLRYPIVYGRRSMLGFERGIVARLRAGRRRIILPDGGLSVYSRLADRNAAHMIGLLLDRPEASAGQLYQCADDEQYSVRQWTELLLGALPVDLDVEFVSVPVELSRPSWDLLPTGPLASPHTLVQTPKARRELGYADIVRPVDVLAGVADALWADPVSAEFDAPGEDEVLAAFDRLSASLTERLGWLPDAGQTKWHPYPHPKASSGPAPTL